MTINKNDHLKHISHQFNTEMGDLKNSLLSMGALVAQQISAAMQAFIDGDSIAARSIRDRDKEVDAMELGIDEEANQVIARRQPAAGDLRLVMAVVKMVADIERVGDEAKKIAKLALASEQQDALPMGALEIRHIGRQVTTMLQSSLQAFELFDSGLALQVMHEDELVDKEYRSALRALITFMMEDPRSITRCLNVMLVLRSLERVGDHAGNLAEQVIFMVEGTDVRHAPMQLARDVVEGKL